MTATPQASQGQDRGGWPVGRFDRCGFMAEIVPFGHGFESGPVYHCWAIVRSSREDRVCGRAANMTAGWRVGVHVCSQHYLQIVRNGLHVVRPSREQLVRMLGDLDREAALDATIV